MNEFEDDEEPLEPLFVLVNSGFGKKSHLCLIKDNSMMTLPPDLVRELHLERGDDVDFSLDEETLTLYARAIRRQWQIPEWLEE